MTCEEAGCPMCYPPTRALTREELGCLLNRKPPPGSWRDFTDPDADALQASNVAPGTTNGTQPDPGPGCPFDERPWEDFEFERAGAAA